MSAARGRWRWAGRALLTVGCAAVVAISVDSAVLWGLVRAMSPGLGLCGMTLFACAPLVVALRWHSLLRLDGVEVSYGWAARVTLEGFFFGLVVPSSAGADVYRVVRLRRHHEGIARATTNVLACRVIGLLSMCMIGLLASVAHPSLPPPVRGTAIATCGGIGLAALLLVNPWAARGAARLARMVGFERPAATLVSSAEQLQRYVTHGSWMLALLALSAFQQVMTVAAMWAFALAIGVDVGFVLLLLVMPVAWLVGMVPALGGFGPREGAMVFLLQASGVPIEASTAIAVLGVVATLGRAAVGGVWALLARPVADGAVR